MVFPEFFYTFVMLCQYDLAMETRTKILNFSGIFRVNKSATAQEIYDILLFECEI